MKALFHLPLLAAALLACGACNDNEPAGPVVDQSHVITDEALRTFCIEQFDTNKDGLLSEQEAESVTEINLGEYASTIASLEGIQIFKNLESIVCHGAEQLKSVDLSQNTKMTTLAQNAFNTCSALVSVKLPATVTTIGSTAFSRCSELKTITLPEGLATIGNSAFNECIKLPALVLPSTLREIGANAFYGCESLEEIVLPEGIEVLEKECLMMCVGLKRIVLPSTLTQIKDSAITFCTQIESVTCHAVKPPFIPALWIASTQTLYVPQESVKEYEQSNWNAFFEQILPIEE